MPKAKAHPDQLGFDFKAPAPQSGVAGLAGLERRICATVGTVLASAMRPREIIAAEMSVLLDEEVSRAMLDAYSSPARTDHRDRSPAELFGDFCAARGVADERVQSLFERLHDELTSTGRE